MFASVASCFHGPGDPPLISGEGKGVTSPMAPKDGDESVDDGDKDRMVVSEADKLDRKLGGVTVEVEEVRVERFASASMMDELLCIAAIPVNRGAKSVCTRRFPCEGVCIWGSAGRLEAGGVSKHASLRDKP